MTSNLWRSLTNVFSTAASKPPRLNPSKPVSFAEPSCLSTCSDPCDVGHASYPAYIKINTTDPLEGTVKQYARHWIVCRPDLNDEHWPARVEGGTDERDDKEHKHNVEAVCNTSSGIEPLASLTRQLNTKHTEDDEREPPRTMISLSSLTSLLSHTFSADSTARILLFPEWKYIDVRAEFLETNTGSQSALLAALEGGDTATDVTKKPLPATTYIFVCTHKRRDKRCGITGPLLIEAFRDSLKSGDDVVVGGISHIGGHKFAGNVIIYQKDSVIDGTWYGRVKPCHVEPILLETVRNQRILKPLWRGTQPQPTSSMSW